VITRDNCFRLLLPNSCLAETPCIGYRAQMPLSLHKIARYVAQKAASDPEAREKAVKVTMMVPLTMVVKP